MMRTAGTYFLLAALALFGYIAGCMAYEYTHTVQVAAVERVSPEQAVQNLAAKQIPSMGMLVVKLDGGVVFVCGMKSDMNGEHVVELIPDALTPMLPADRYVFLAIWPSGGMVRGAMTIKPGSVLTLELSDPTEEAKKVEQKKHGPGEQTT